MIRRVSTAAGSSLSGIFATYVARFLVSWAKQTLGPDQTPSGPALSPTPTAVEGRPERDRSRETYGAHRGVEAVRGYIRDLALEGHRPPAGATAGEVSALAPAWARLFEHPMPDDYRAFLQASNGLLAGGIVLYGTVDTHTDDGFVPGLLDSNERLLDAPASADAPLRFVGESGHELFAHDTARGQWCVVDRADWQDVGGRAFDSFAALLSHVLSPLLPKGPR